MTILGSGARGGIYQASPGDRDVLTLIIYDLTANIQTRQTCLHPDRQLFLECCSPDVLRCIDCAFIENVGLSRECVACCACGAEPASPVQIANVARILVAGSFCGSCARILGELRPDIEATPPRRPSVA